MGPGASKIHPSECHLVQIPYNKIEDLAPARLPDSSLRCRQTHLPLRPPESGARPQRKEGVHFSTFSMHHRVSLAGPLLPRPWTLKTSRPRTVPRGFPVSHSPEVPWGMQLSLLPCSFPHRLSGQRVTHIHPPVLSSLFCTARKHAGSAWRHAMLTPCRS